MRRMYSQAELSAIIKEVFLADVASGQIDLPDLIQQALPEIDWSAFELDCKSVKADSIIENMSGYSFTEASTENITYNYLYAGACKNGNKLTLSVALEVTRTDSTAGSNYMIGTFDIPKDIHDQLVPTSFGGVQAISIGVIYHGSTYNAGSSLPFIITKEGTNGLKLTCYNANNLTLNTKYLVRAEITFLLSENLITEE